MRRILSVIVILLLWTTPMAVAGSKQKTIDKLLSAAEIGDIETLKKEINDTNINSISQNGFTMLYVASYEGHVDVVNLLIKAGANVNTPRNDGFTPLFRASTDGYVKIVNILIKAGAND